MPKPNLLIFVLMNFDDIANFYFVGGVTSDNRYSQLLAPCITPPFFPLSLFFLHGGAAVRRLGVSPGVFSCLSSVLYLAVM